MSRTLNQPKMDKAVVELPPVARELGLEALQAVFELTLDGGIIAAAVVKNELRQLAAPPLPAAIGLPNGKISPISRPTSSTAEMYLAS